MHADARTRTLRYDCYSNVKDSRDWHHDKNPSCASFSWQPLHSPLLALPHLQFCQYHQLLVDSRPRDDNNNRNECKCMSDKIMLLSKLWLFLWRASSQGNVFQLTKIGAPWCGRRAPSLIILYGLFDNCCRWTPPEKVVIFSASRIILKPTVYL